jgi:O-antigen/teichoic acid export membrane protein
VTLARRFGEGFVFTGITMAFTGGSTLLVNVVVAGLLGKAVFGEFTVVLTTLLMIGNVAPLAVGVTATKYVAELRSVNSPRMGQILGLCTIVATTMGLVSAVALAGASPWLARSVLKNAQVASGLVVVSVAVFFTVQSAYRSGTLAGFEAYGSVAKAAVLGGTCYAIFCIAGARYGGRDGALLGVTASAAAQWWALRRSLRAELLRRNLRVRYRDVSAERGVLAHFSLPAALSGLSTMPALWVGSVFLVRQPHGYEQMALYGAAATLRVLVLFVPQMVNGVASSILNNVRSKGEWRDFRRLVQWNLIATAGVALTGASAVTMAGRWLLKFFGPGFEGGYVVLLLLVGSAVVESLTLAVWQVLQAEGRIWSWALGVTLPRDLLIVVLAYVLCRRYEAAGLAWSYMLGWAFALLTASIFASRAILRSTKRQEAALSAGTSQIE